MASQHASRIETLRRKARNRHWKCSVPSCRMLHDKRLPAPLQSLRRRQLSYSAGPHFVLVHRSHTPSSQMRYLWICSVRVSHSGLAVCLVKKTSTGRFKDTIVSRPEHATEPERPGEMKVSYSRPCAKLVGPRNRKLVPATGLSFIFLPLPPTCYCVARTHHPSGPAAPSHTPAFLGCRPATPCPSML